MEEPRHTQVDPIQWKIVKWCLPVILLSRKQACKQMRLAPHQWQSRGREQFGE